MAVYLLSVAEVAAKHYMMRRARGLELICLSVQRKLTQTPLPLRSRLPFSDEMSLVTCRLLGDIRVQQWVLSFLRHARCKVWLWRWRIFLNILSPDCKIARLQSGEFVRTLGRMNPRELNDHEVTSHAFFFDFWSFSLASWTRNCIYIHTHIFLVFIASKLVKHVKKNIQITGFCRNSWRHPTGRTRCKRNLFFFFKVYF